MYFCYAISDFYKEWVKNLLSIAFSVLVIPERNKLMPKNEGKEKKRMAEICFFGGLKVQILIFL